MKVSVIFAIIFATIIFGDETLANDDGDAGMDSQMGNLMASNRGLYDQLYDMNMGYNLPYSRQLR